MARSLLQPSTPSGPAPRSRPSTRRLATVAVLACASLSVAACSDPASGPGSDPGPGPRPTSQAASSAAPLPGPGRTDRVLPPRRLRAPDWKPPQEKPNFLVITADDAAIGDVAFMPHVQEDLAAQGATLSGLAPTPICVPARASLITGQYAHNHGALTISGEGGGYDAFVDAGDDDTLPVWLSRAGYDTLFIGKYLNGYGHEDPRHIPPGWTSWQGAVDPSTYRFFKTRVNDNGTVRRAHRHNTRVFSRLTQQNIRQQARAGKPWFMWVNYVAPHFGGPREDDDPIVTHPGSKYPMKTTVPMPRDRNSFQDQDLPDKPNIWEAETSDKHILDGVHLRFDRRTKDDVRESYQQRLESEQGIDRALGRAIDTLRRTGQLDNTYVLFTSDNGYAQGEHNLTGKLFYFDEQVRVPMYLRGPGVPAGATGLPVTNPDIATTVAALAGATPTRPQDGVNVMPWLSTQANSRVVPIEAYPVKGGRERLYSGVRVGPWTYALGKNGKEEVYYRVTDPFELSNVAQDERFSTQVRQLRRLSRKYADCRGSSCPSGFWRNREWRESPTGGVD